MRQMKKIIIRPTSVLSEYDETSLINVGLINDTASNFIRPILRFLQTTVPDSFLLKLCTMRLFYYTYA